MNKSINTFIILSFLLLLFGNTTAQHFFVKTYTIEDGLPTRNIYDACQDKDGIMWFATSYGISKYDGFSFKNYNYKDGLPNQVFRKIMIDEKGVLWAMPNKILDTIVYFKDNKWSRIFPPAKESESSMMNAFDVIYKNGKPVIVMGSDNGFYIYENNTWNHFSISGNSSLNYVYAVLAKNNKFYLSTNNGICIVDNGKMDWGLNKLIRPYGTDIIAINIENKNTPDEKIWMLNEKWLGYIQNNKFHMASNKFQLPHPSIFYYAFVTSNNSGTVFFGNIWAKYYISKDNNNPVPLMYENGFSSNGATSVFIDKEQNVWITDTRGLNKINNLKILSYFTKNGMLEDEVTAIAEMNDGRIVFGHNNGLSILDNNTFKTIEFPDLKLNTRRVSDMMKDKSGNIWFSSISRGLGKLSPNGNIIWYSPVKYPVISVVHEDRNGRIWVGADTKLLYLENNELTEFVQFNKINSMIRKIFSDDKGGIFIAGSSGLWHLINNKIEKIPSPDKKADNVFAYYKNRDGIEFVGTNNGLCFIDHGSIVKFRNKDVEINTPVFFIFQDHDENYWIGSNTGVYKWDGKSKLEVFNVYNGLAGWETNRAAGMTDSKGRVWIGTDQGLTCFEPGFDNFVIPEPIISLLYAEDSKGEKHSLSKESLINYDDNTLVFQFRGISFVNEDLVKYKYKLEGYDQDWQDINQSMLGQIKYIGLKPGKYALNVMAKNFSGAWSKVIKSETIRIAPPYYLTWWFILGAIILLSAIIYGIVKLNVQRLHNSKLLKEIIERKRIEQALNESKQKYKDLVELLPETIYEADFSGKLVYMNDTGFRQFGYHHDELDTVILIDQLIASESHDAIHLHMELVYERKKPSRVSLTGITKTGKLFPISIHSVPIIVNGKCIGTRGIIIDLTEQKRFEDQLQKNAEDLQALNNSKDKFFSIIAHDLRSPFNTFLGFTEILDEEMETLSHEELKSIITSMRSSATNLYQLLENLLEWSLLHRDVTKFEPETVLLSQVAQDCQETFSVSAKQKGIGVMIEIPEFLKVEADIHMLQTIIRNLLSNAIKFTPKGGYVQISASANEDHYITTAIKDSGIGIHADMLKKIFLIDTNNKTKGTEGEVSTGLGLILCKEFVEKHGGKIWAESEEGKGSTFYFTLKGITT